MEDRTSFATAYTTRRADFRDSVLYRDRSCILTGGHAEDVVACHIVPHAKGNEVCSQYHLNHSKVLMLAKYMRNFLNIRSEEIVDPPFDGIDDPRNGILLNPAFHHAFGESRVAFLRVSYCCDPIVSMSLIYS
jgi:hypothetical protein